MFEVISKQGFLKRLRHFIDSLRDTSELLKNAMFTKRNELTSMNIIFLLIRGHTKDYNYVFDVRYLLSKTCFIKSETNGFRVKQIINSY